MYLYEWKPNSTMYCGTCGKHVKLVDVAIKGTYNKLFDKYNCLCNACQLEERRAVTWRCDTCKQDVHYDGIMVVRWAHRRTYR